MTALLFYVGEPRPSPAPAREIVMGYLASLQDRLIDEGFEVHIWECARGYLENALDEGDRFDVVFDLSYQLLGAPPKRKSYATVNHSRVDYGTPESLALAMILGEALWDWGACCAFGHKHARPAIRDELSRPPTLRARYAVAVWPFDLDGPDVDAYLPHLRTLGLALAQAVVDYFTETAASAAG